MVIVLCFLSLFFFRDWLVILSCLLYIFFVWFSSCVCVPLLCCLCSLDCSFGDCWALDVVFVVDS